jgi:hypothetical protein
MVDTISWSWSKRTLELNGTLKAPILLGHSGPQKVQYIPWYPYKCIICSSDRYTTFSTFIVQSLCFHLEVVSNGNVDFMLAQPYPDLARWLLSEWPAWTLYPVSLLTAVRVNSHLAAPRGGSARLMRMLKTVMCSEGMNRWHYKKLCFSK